jgi:hypothetical protein
MVGGVKTLYHEGSKGKENLVSWCLGGFFHHEGTKRARFALRRLEFQFRRRRGEVGAGRAVEEHSLIGR